MSEDILKIIFSNNLNYYIAQSGMKQKDVAAAIGEKKPTFNLWCTGRAIPSVHKIKNLAEYFGISVIDLISEKTEDDPQDISVLVSDANAMEIAKLYKGLNMEDRSVLMKIAKLLYDQNHDE